MKSSPSAESLGRLQRFELSYQEPANSALQPTAKGVLI